MIVTMEMTDGRVREFNLGSMCTPDPWGDKRGGQAVVSTELDLRLDLMERDARARPGHETLRLDVIRHVARLRGASSQTVALDEYTDSRGRQARLPAADRLPSVSLVLAGPEELAMTSVIYVSSSGQHKAVAWRQGSGNWLVNGTRFEAARRLFYTDSQTTSTSSQACRLFSYVMRSAGADGELSPEEAAEMIGFPYAALEEAIESEAANAGTQVGDTEPKESASIAPLVPFGDDGDGGDDDE